MNDRVVLMGSPDFTLPTLYALHQNFDLVAVVTQPDRPAGRGRKLTPPPVKAAALQLGLPVIQPPSLKKDPAAIEQLRAWQPAVIIVAAFAQILRPDVLDLPPHGCINIHASLLPRWRGAAPINAAILHGDHETGITIMRMAPGLDDGPILRQRAIPIGPLETAGSLFEKLAQLGAQLLVETLPDYLQGRITPQPQDPARVTYAPMLNKADGDIDVSQPAEALARKVRAFNPWPGATFKWDGAVLKIHRAHAARGKSDGQAGERTIHQGLPAIRTGDGLLVLDEVQPAGKRPMPGKSFLQGARDWA